MNRNIKELLEIDLRQLIQNSQFLNQTTDISETPYYSKSNNIFLQLNEPFAEIFPIIELNFFNDVFAHLIFKSELLAKNDQKIWLQQARRFKKVFKKLRNEYGYYGQDNQKVSDLHIALTNGGLFWYFKDEQHTLIYDDEASDADYYGIMTIYEENKIELIITDYYKLDERILTLVELENIIKF